MSKSAAGLRYPHGALGGGFRVDLGAVVRDAGMAPVVGAAAGHARPLRAIERQRQWPRPQGALPDRHRREQRQGDDEGHLGTCWPLGREGVLYRAAFGRQHGLGAKYRPRFHESRRRQAERPDAPQILAPRLAGSSPTEPAVELEVFAKNHPLLPRDEPILSDIDGPHYFPEISILQYSVKQLVEMHRGNVHALQLTRLAEEQIWGSIADILKKQQDDTRIDVVISTAWDSEEGGSRRKAKVKPMRIERKYFEVPLYIILRSEDNSGYKDLFDESTHHVTKVQINIDCSEERNLIGMQLEVLWQRGMAGPENRNALGKFLTEFEHIDRDLADLRLGGWHGTPFARYEIASTMKFKESRNKRPRQQTDPYSQSLFENFAITAIGLILGRFPWSASDVSSPVASIRRHLVEFVLRRREPLFVYETTAPSTFA
ncbi:hypothetical protein M885DRAFT_226640 [Pelagophyceae sp. CCMP2097]|nr:hypothetical protein M885DRAFT_226640 [Pelagophyceae sp. CCMP2097]